MSRETVETDLLAAIAAEPDAIEPRLIYGDWLQSENDPRGELIAVQAARLERADDIQLEMREKELITELTNALLAKTAEAPLSAGVIKRWHLGFVDALALAVRDVRLLRSTHREWFAQPVFAVVRELDIDSKYARNLRFITQTQLATTLRRLAFGDAQLAMDEPTLEAIATRAPKLAALTLRTVGVPDLAPLHKLPLVELRLELRELTSEGLQQIMSAPWRLEHLGMKPVRAVADDIYPTLAMLYDGSSLTTVKHFAVDGGMPAMDIIDTLSVSKRALTVESFTADFQRIPYATQTRAERHREVLKNVKFLPTLGTSNYADTEQCVLLGNFLNYRLDRPGDGLVLYEKALRITPEHISARHNLGIALRKLKRYDESLVAFDTIINQSKNPTASMFNGRHYTLCELGRRDEARRDLERAIQIDANFADAWNNIGCERQYIGDAEGALAAFRRCMQIDANHGYARKNEADLLLELGLAGEALPIYLELLREKPGHPPLLVMLAYAQFETGDLAGARATVDTRLADPNVEYPNRLNILRALTLQGLGNPTAARTDLDTVAMRTDCPSWFALTVFVQHYAERAAWTRMIPDSAVTPKEMVDAIDAYAKATRAAGATEMHEASVDDQMDIAELAVAAALRANDRPLAVRRVRALAAFYVEQGPKFFRNWWQTLATALHVTMRELDEDSRALLDRTERTVRGRKPVAELMAIVE